MRVCQWMICLVLSTDVRKSNCWKADTHSVFLYSGNEPFDMLGGYFLPNRGVMKNLGITEFFSREIGGHKKKSRDYWVASNFNDNFVQWNSPQNAYFPRYAHWGCMFLRHCSSGGGHKSFDHQIGGSQKYCRGTFGNTWPPLFQRKWWPPLLW